MKQCSQDVSAILTNNGKISGFFCRLFFPISATACHIVNANFWLVSGT
jgi:hypothetical protein